MLESRQLFSTPISVTIASSDTCELSEILMATSCTPSYKPLTTCGPVHGRRLQDDKSIKQGPLNTVPWNKPNEWGHAWSREDIIYGNQKSVLLLRFCWILSSKQRWPDAEQELYEVNTFQHFVVLQPFRKCWIHISTRRNWPNRKTGHIST